MGRTKVLEKTGPSNRLRMLSPSTYVKFVAKKILIFVLTCTVIFGPLPKLLNIMIFKKPHVMVSCNEKDEFKYVCHLYIIKKITSNRTLARKFCY